MVRKDYGKGKCSEVVREHMLLLEYMRISKMPENEVLVMTDESGLVLRDITTNKLFYGSYNEAIKDIEAYYRSFEQINFEEEYHDRQERESQLQAEDCCHE